MCLRIKDEAFNRNSRAAEALRELRSIRRDSSGSKPRGRKLSPQSPTQNPPQIATKVKNLVQYRDGKLESILLPILVTSCFLPKRPNNKNFESLDDVPVVFEDEIMRSGAIRNGKNPAFGITDDENEDKIAPGGINRPFIHGGNQGYKMKTSGTKRITTEDEFQEYGGSEDDEVGPYAITVKKNVPKKSSENQLLQEEGSFMGVLLHAISCKDCDDLGCKKMRLVLGHFLSCKKFRNEERVKFRGKNCAICDQFLTIVGHHANSCKTKTGSCAVPMCDIFRAKKGNNNNKFVVI